MLAVNVPVPVKFAPKLIIEFPVHVNAFAVLKPGIAIVPLTANEPELIVTILSLRAVLVLARVRLAQLTIPVPIAKV